MEKSKELGSSYGDLKKIVGNALIEERYLGKRFYYNIYTFMQPNPWVAEALYSLAVKLAGRGKTLVELYSGVGVLSVLLSKNFEEIYAYEVVEESVKLAKKNAEVNEAENIKFYARGAEEFEEEADLLVVDPPRSGLMPKVIERILELRPRRILYLSCNPRTAYRDVMLLDYKVKDVYLFDMLPNTPRSELLISMEARDL